MESRSLKPLQGRSWTPASLLRPSQTPASARTEDKGIDTMRPKYIDGTEEPHEADNMHYKSPASALMVSIAAASDALVAFL